MGSRHLFRFDLPCVYSRVTTAIHSLHLRCSGASLCLLSLRPARRLKQHVCWKKGAGEIWSLNSLISVPKGDWGHTITPSTGMVPHVTNRLKSRENYFSAIVSKIRIFSILPGFQKVQHFGYLWIILEFSTPQRSQVFSRVRPSTCSSPPERMCGTSSGAPGGTWGHPGAPGDRTWREMGSWKDLWELAG